MANMNIFFFYLLKIFGVSKMAILKCLGQDIKIDIFSGNFGSIVEVYRVEFFLCVMMYLVFSL